MTTNKKTSATKKTAKPAPKPKAAKKKAAQDAPGTATADAPVGTVSPKPARKPKGKVQPESQPVAKPAGELLLPPADRGKILGVKVFNVKAEPGKMNVIILTELRKGRVVKGGAYFYSARGVSRTEAEALAEKLRKRLAATQPDRAR